MSGDASDRRRRILKNVVPTGFAAVCIAVSEPFLLDGDYAVGGALVGLGLLTFVVWFLLR